MGEGGLRRACWGREAGMVGDRVWHRGGDGDRDRGVLEGDWKVYDQTESVELLEEMEGDGGDGHDRGKRRGGSVVKSKIHGIQ